MAVASSTLYYSTKKASFQDFLVVLTDKGRKAFFHHRDFHKKMIRSAVKGLDEAEMKAFIKCLKNPCDFFDGIE